MKVDLKTVGVVVAALLVGAAGAFAQALGPGEGGPGLEGPPAAGRFLELTEEQRDALRHAFEQRRPEVEALHEQMRENRKLLRDALESGNPDATSVGELVIEGHALQERGRALREESKAALEDLLTPEQKRKLELLEAARAAGGFRGPSERMGPRGNPPR